MRNKVLKKLLMIAMAVTMISGTSIATVYANANPPAEETTTQVVEETATESTEDTEKKIPEGSPGKGIILLFLLREMPSWWMIRKMMIRNSSLPSRPRREIHFTWSLTVPAIQKMYI